MSLPLSLWRRIYVAVVVDMLLSMFPVFCYVFVVEVMPLCHCRCLYVVVVVFMSLSLYLCRCRFIYVVVCLSSSLYYVVVGVSS